MDEAELLFTALAEMSTRHIAEKDQAMGFDENKKSAVEGGKISKGAKEALEKKTGKMMDRL